MLLEVATIVGFPSGSLLKPVNYDSKCQPQVTDLDMVLGRLDTAEEPSRQGTRIGEC